MCGKHIKAFSKYFPGLNMHVWVCMWEGRKQDGSQALSMETLVYHWTLAGGQEKALLTGCRVVRYQEFLSVLPASSAFTGYVIRLDLDSADVLFFRRRQWPLLWWFRSCPTILSMFTTHLPVSVNFLSENYFLSEALGFLRYWQTAVISENIERRLFKIKTKTKQVVYWSRNQDINKQSH